MNGNITIKNGDALEVLRGMDDNSVESVVTDPPYGLSKQPDISEVLTKWLAGEDYERRGGGFMGKTWDSFVPGPALWSEVYRVLKPGGHALVFAGTRTQDLMTIALRMAGFEVRDVIEWLYFSGFPKNHDVGKAFDKRAGAEREVIGYKQRTFSDKVTGWKLDKTGKAMETAPTTELARKWDGWGTALKPAHEPIIVVRKPLAGTVTDTVEKHGTGAINADGARIGTKENLQGSTVRNDIRGGAYASGHKANPGDIPMYTQHGKGRFPANIVTTEDNAFYSKYANVTPQELSKKASKKDRNSDWRGEEITLEPKEGGTTVASTKGQLKDLRVKNPDYERKVPQNANNHPTVKPIDLMAWLVRLVTPPEGIVLDPFAGSGTTGVAAKREGFNAILIEREAEYAEITRERCAE
jgi:DNA modification methylase